MNYIFKIKTMIVLLMMSSAVFATESKYVWDVDLATFPSYQKEFIEILVKAHRKSDFKLGKSILHPDIVKDEECLGLWKRWFSKKTIKPQYAVKIKPGEKSGTLSVSIRHQNQGDDSKRSFLKFKNVADVEGKLYINMDCSLYK